MNSQGINLISFERSRQVEEKGFTIEKDQKYTNELIFAARCYILVTGFLATKQERDEMPDYPPGDWPWQENMWKPDSKDPISNLVKAGALIAAEIDRLLRKRESK